MFKLGQVWELDLSTYHRGVHQFNVPTFVYSILTKEEKDYIALTSRKEKFEGFIRGYITLLED